MTTATNIIEYNSHVTSQPNRAKKLNDLQELITALYICKGNYEALANTADLPDLRESCTRYATERSDYASSLYNHLNDQEGNLLTDISWTDTIHNMEEADNVIILDAIIASEVSAEKMYNTYLRNHIPTIEQLGILTAQKASIRNTVNELLDLKTKLNLSNPAIA